MSVTPPAFNLSKLPVIVCSCNILSDGDVKACLGPGPACPRTPAQVYRCLGCSPNCGRCARTIRSIMDQALSAAEEACGGCPLACPGDHHHHGVAERETGAPVPVLG